MSRQDLIPTNIEINAIRTLRDEMRAQASLSATQALQLQLIEKQLYAMRRVYHAANRARRGMAA